MPLLKPSGFARNGADDLSSTGSGIARTTQHSRERSDLQTLAANTSATHSESGERDETMSGLFGSAGAASSTPASSTQGDLSKDVQVSNPPEDSVSSIRFSPATDHLSVASWDKKVRIYEIDSNGNTQGKALFEHEGPVLSTCWSPVRHKRTCQRYYHTDFAYRMDQRSSAVVQTRPRACLTWAQVVLRHNRSLHMISPSGAYNV